MIQTVHEERAPSSPVHRRRRACRACGAEQLEVLLSLGPQPLANAFLRTPEEFEREARYPLDLAFCGSCSLVQLVDVIDPDVLFREYLYVTGTSETMAAHNRAYAASIVKSRGLTASDLVLEAASNDGSLLACFQRFGVRTLGVEPARNIAAMARQFGIPTVGEYFDARTARAIRAAYGPAAIVLANNVLAHVDDTVGFLRACGEAIDERGAVVVEVPYLRELLARLEYDTIYHEHLCYFSVTSLLRLFEAVELRISRVDRVAVHGGSLRVTAEPNVGRRSHAEDVLALADGECRDGLTSRETYVRFAADVALNRDTVRAFLEGLLASGRVVAGYGAPAKGNTLLNYCGIGPTMLPFTVDRNPLKVGRYTPGMHVPVLPVSALLDQRPDYALVLAWNFVDEIVRQQGEFRAAGGRFIVPIPEPRVI